MIFPQFCKNLIEKFKLSLQWVRKDSPSSKSVSKTQFIAKSGGQLIVQQGLTLPEVKDIINDVVDQKLVTVKREAAEIYKNRISDFETEIFNRLEELHPDELNKLREPDLQIVLAEAAVISGRKQDKELRETLANLVIGRIKNCESGHEELKNIVYNEAIKTVEKLTIDQLKIITLCYLLRYTQNNSIISWESFNHYLNTNIKPFLYFKESITEYQHIQYTGCGNIDQLISFSLIPTFRSLYSCLFFKSIEELEVDKLEIPEEIKLQIIEKIDDDGKYFFRFRNQVIMEEWLKANISDNILIDKIISLFVTHIKSEAEAKQDVLEKTELGNKLFNFYKESLIKRLSLTSVGIVIGATYFEQMTGENIDINIWIN